MRPPLELVGLANEWRLSYDGASGFAWCRGHHQHGGMPCAPSVLIRVVATSSWAWCRRLHLYALVSRVPAAIEAWCHGSQQSGLVPWEPAFSLGGCRVRQQCDLAPRVSEVGFFGVVGIVRLRRYWGHQKCDLAPWLAEAWIAAVCADSLAWAADSNSLAWYRGCRDYEN